PSGRCQNGRKVNLPNLPAQIPCRTQLASSLRFGRQDAYPTFNVEKVQSEHSKEYELLGFENDLHSASSTTIDSPTALLVISATMPPPFHTQEENCT
ncbi:MAG: hypothetical protein WBD31_10745, partial [Rubripirellula sp.]